MACKDRSDDSRRLTDAPSAARLVESISRLLQAGASEEEISDLLEAAGACSETVVHPSTRHLPDERPAYRSSPLLDPFQSVGRAWLEWDLDEGSDGEKAFAESFAGRLADRLKTAQAAYDGLGTRLHTLGTLCDTDAHAEAGTRMGRAWHEYGAALGAVADALDHHAAFGDDLRQHADEMWSAWRGVEEISADVSARLADEGLADNLEALSVHLRLLGQPLQQFASYLAVPFDEAPALLVAATLGYGRANLALVESMSLVIIASVGPPAETLVGCPRRCPFAGCTNWCTRRYSTPRCTPWRRIIGGVGGPAGVYHRVCTWVVKETEVSTCSCYRSRWDRFFDQNACASTRITRSAFTTDRTQEWSAIVNTPPAPAPPPPFTTSSPGRC